VDAASSIVILRSCIQLDKLIQIIDFIASDLDDSIPARGIYGYHAAEFIRKTREGPVLGMIALSYLTTIVNSRLRPPKEFPDCGGCAADPDSTYVFFRGGHGPSIRG
jgi:hypothetical protein